MLARSVFTALRGHGHSSYRQLLFHFPSSSESPSIPKVSHADFPGVVLGGADSGSVRSFGERPPLPVGLHPSSRASQTSLRYPGISETCSFLSVRGQRFCISNKFLGAAVLPAQPDLRVLFCFLAIVTGYNGNGVRYGAVHTGKPCCSECVRFL